GYEVTMAADDGAKKEMQSSYKSEMKKYAQWGKYLGISFFVTVLIAVSVSVHSAITSGFNLGLLLQVFCYLWALVLVVFWYLNTRAFVSNKATYISSLKSREEVEASSLLQSVWVSKATLWISAAFFMLSLGLSAVLWYSYHPRVNDVDKQTLPDQDTYG